MKKLLAVFFVLTIALGVVACNETTTDAIGDTVLNFEEDNQVFTIEALSAASLLNYSSVSELNYIPLAETTEALEETEGDDLVTEEIDELDQYLELMNNYLGDNDTLSVTVLESDREAYVNLVSFTTINASSDEVVYYLYYNETVYEEEPVEEETTETTETTDIPVTTEAPETTDTVDTESSATPLSNKSQTFMFNDEDDESIVYSLEGIIIYGDTEYNVEGKKVVLENDTEIMRLYAWVDHDNFVKVSYKTDLEDGNTKFFYEVKEDGVIITKSRIQVIEQEGAKVVHLDFEDETQKAKYIFSITEEEGNTIIHIKYDIRDYVESTREKGNIHVEVTEDLETGELTYTYKILGNGSGEKYSKQIEKKHQSKGQSNNGNGNKNM